MITAYCRHPHLAQAPPQGPPPRKIYVIISSEPDGKSAEIPVAEGVQETDPKCLDDESVEALDPEYYEAALFQLSEDYDHSKETHWKAVGKYNH